MRVFRVVDVHNSGVFVGGAINEAQSMVAKARGVESFYDTEEPCPQRHPTPHNHREEGTPLQKLFCYDEETAACPHDYIFGFETLKALVEWFDSEALRVAMNEIGCTVREFEVPEEHVRKGRYQLAFDRNHMTEVGSTPLPTVLS